MVTGRSIQEVGSYTSKGLKISQLPASLSLGWGRAYPLFPLHFSPLSSASCSRDKGEKPFLLLPSGCQLLRLERSILRNSLLAGRGRGGSHIFLLDHWFRAGPGARDGAVPGAVAPSCLGSPGMSSSIPPTGSAPSSLPAQAIGVSHLKKKLKKKIAVTCASAARLNSPNTPSLVPWTV